MLRIGTGFDVHKFKENESLFLGGVSVPFSRGLSGHSDADVLLHAVIDAILGATGYGDIGELFPSTDNSLKNIRSTVLLEKVWNIISQSGWWIVNLDSVIICEHPKVSPHRSSMKKTIADILGTSEDRIMVKGTTTETLGFTGREEGIAAHAVVLIERSS